MEIDYPTPTLEPQLQRLWQLAFGDEESFIRDFFSQRQAEKPLKTDSVCDLILCLVIRKVEQPLQHQYLEHHYIVKRMAPCAAFAFFFHALSQSGTETFKIYDFQPFQ